MTFDTSAFDFGEGLIIVPGGQGVEGAPFSDVQTTTCEVSRFGPPFGYINVLYYFLHTGTLGESVDISAAIAALEAACLSAFGTSMDYMSIGLGFGLEGHFGIASCGDRDHATGINPGEGPGQAPDDAAHGWTRTFNVNGLSLTADGSPAGMAAIYNSSGLVFTSLFEQEPPVGSTFVGFRGYMLRDVAHTWAGQDVTNDANRIMFTPAEFSTVAWSLADQEYGEIHSPIDSDTGLPVPFSLSIHGYKTLGGGDTPSGIFAGPALSGRLRSGPVIGAGVDAVATLG